MSGDTAHDGLDTRKVAGEAKRRARRKRTSETTRLRKINAKAREREAAWRVGDQANAVARLTTELAKEYEGLRADHAGAPGSPYLGTTTNVRRWESKHGTTNDNAPGGQTEREVTTPAGHGRRNGP